MGHPSAVEEPLTLKKALKCVHPPVSYRWCSLATSAASLISLSACDSRSFALGVAAELVFVCLLGLLGALVGLNDVALSGREIAMASSIDVHDRGLGKHTPTQAEVMQSMRVITKFLLVMCFPLWVK